MGLPTGASVEYEFDLAGRQTSIRSFNGGTSHTEYDDAGQVAAVTDALGRVIRHLYDDAGREIAIVFPNGASKEIEYDLLGRKTAEIDLAKNRTEYAYDAGGRVTCVTDAMDQVTRFEYDELGNMLKQTDAKGRITRWTYDNKGRMLSRTLPLGMTEYYTYGTCCNYPISHTDFRGHVINFEYDSMGRLISKTYPNDATETYTYNALGNRTQVSSATGTTSYEYDEYQRLELMISPDGSEVTYTYDSMGNTASVTQPSGTTWNIYDKANQLSRVIDSASGETLYEYALSGRHTRITRPNGTITEYSYDDLDRLIEVVNKKSGSEVLSSYQYTLDNAGNRTRVVEHSGRTVDYTYDATYKLTSETINDPTSGLMAISYEYDEVGNRTSRTVDGVTTTYVYDDNDRLLSEQTSVKVGQLVPDKDLEQKVGSALTVFRATVTFFGILYLIGLFLVVRYLAYPGLSLRDKPGQLRTTICVLFLMMPFLVMGPEPVSGMQVAEIQHARLKTTIQENLTYTYDDNGNRISKSDGTNTTYYTYDYEDRLVAITEGVSRTEYGYDEDGLRIKQNVDGEETSFLYDKLKNFPHVLEEHSGEGIVTAQYTWGIGLDPLSMVQSGSTSYYLTDGNLNIRQLVSESEEITDTYDLEAFGSVLQKTGSTPNPYLLHGQYYDANAGYYYMRARWLDHATGGFTSLDPAPGDPKYPLSLHKYLFAAGNPIMQYDPSGRSNLMEVIVVSVIIIGLIMWLYSAIQYLIGAIFNGDRGQIIWEGFGTTISGSGTWAGAGGSSFKVTTPECHNKRDKSGRVKGIGEYIVILFGFTISWSFEFTTGKLKLQSPFYYGPDGGVFSGGAGLFGGTVGVGYASLNYSLMTLGFGSTSGDSIIGINLIASPGIPLPSWVSTGTATVARNLFSWQGGLSWPINVDEEKC